MLYFLTLNKNNKRIIIKFNEKNNYDLKEILKFTTSFKNEEELTDYLLINCLIPTDYFDGTYEIVSYSNENLNKAIEKVVSNIAFFNDIEYIQNIINKYYFNPGTFNFENSIFNIDNLIKYYQIKIKDKDFIKEFIKFMKRDMKLYSIKFYKKELDILTYYVNHKKDEDFEFTVDNDFVEEIDYPNDLELTMDYLISKFCTTKKQNGNKYIDNIRRINDLVMFAIKYENKHRPSQKNKYKPKKENNYTDTNFQQSNCGNITWTYNLKR